MAERRLAEELDVLAGDKGFGVEEAYYSELNCPVSRILCILSEMISPVIFSNISNLSRI